MERSTQIWVGVVVLAVLGGGIYYKAKEDQKIGAVQTMSADLPDMKVPDEVDKISITNADKGEVVLEKKGDKWELTKPIRAPANQANVKSLIDNMKELKAKDVVAVALSDEQKKDFQFEPNKGVHVVAYQGENKKLDATFGKSGGRGQMAMVDGKPGVFVVGGYASYLYTREAKGWRDTEIFKFDDANANQFSIENKNGTLSFTKGDNWAGTAKGAPIADLDEDKVKSALRTFKSLNAEDFGDGKTPADTGLDNPEGKITINLKDGAGKYSLKVGKVATGTSHYAQKEGDAAVFVIGSHAADLVLGDASKFQKAKDAGAAKDAGKPVPPPALTVTPAADFGGPSEEP
ncbi:MAG: DUF4340 domain-containing protein [Polyangiaceae bacterium]|nr:DUF4340 domain-containing protein [Polyangiaceae bacterium]